MPPLLLDRRLPPPPLQQQQEPCAASRRHPASWMTSCVSDPSPLACSPAGPPARPVEGAADLPGRSAAGMEP